MGRPIPTVALAILDVTIENPCLPGDIAHEMAAPRPGRGHR
jgi:hypothetical protein